MEIEEEVSLNVADIVATVIIIDKPMLTCQVYQVNGRYIVDNTEWRASYATLDMALHDIAVFISDTADFISDSEE